MIKKYAREPLRSTATLFFVITAVALSLVACGSRAREDQPSASPSVTPLPVAELLRSADEAYAGREDLARVRKGLETLRHIRAVRYDDYEAAWRTARLDYTLGDRSTDDKEREQAFTDGMEAGETATKIEPNKPEGHFWLGANYGGYAEFKGLIYGATYAEKLRKEMETVIKLDENFEGGSAYVALGQLDTELPEMLGGDPARAVSTLEKGLHIDPNNALIHLHLAEAYLATKRKDDARRELNWVINSKPDPEHLPEQKDAVKQAHELLSKNF
jgi:tetratricopeptide (TPR) repeat protein